MESENKYCQLRLNREKELRRIDIHIVLKSLYKFNFTKEKSISHFNTAFKNYLENNYNDEVIQSFLCDEWIIFKERNIALQKIYVTDALGVDHTIHYKCGYNEQYGEKILVLCGKLIYLLIDYIPIYNFNFIEVAFTINIKNNKIVARHIGFDSFKDDIELFNYLF